MHHDQKYRGDTYFDAHLSMVVKVLINSDPDTTDNEMMVAWLHDIMEDTSIDTYALQDFGFPPEVITAVDTLTRRFTEDYVGYIERIMLSDDPIATKVKVADLKVNLSAAMEDASVDNYPALKQNAEERCERYRFALMTLTGRQQ